MKTASRARAVQIVHSSRRGSRDIDHIGSAHDDAASEALKAVARQRPAVGQPELGFGPDFAALQAGSGTGGRIVEPTSKLDSLRVVEETGFDPRPMPGTGSVSPGSPKNAAWSRRSRSGCSPTQAGFR
ncbi:hypothetical protein AB0J55_14170 [Amycolatopsis sp. NPDC049688]|uniref:hypothetical protein n=1 Tax=Amycolatopsis sp. NPDC049688 TaxID=3154733 RepID=UPI0034441888